MDVFRTLVIPTARQVVARQLATAFEKVGIDMFTSRLSASGAETATHMISSGMVPQWFADVMPLKTWTQDGQGAWLSVTVSTGDAAAIRAKALEKGYSVTLTQVNNVLSSLDVSEQLPFVVMDRLGLKPINPPIN